MRAAARPVWLRALVAVAAALRQVGVRRTGRMRGVGRVLLMCATAAAAGAGVVGAQEGTVRVSDVVIHYWPGQQRFAESLLQRGSFAPFPGLPADILDRGEEVTVYVAPDAARWDSLTGGRAPEWGAGIALPLQGIVILPGYVSDRGGTHTLPVILRHELAHIALQRHVRGPIPRWFNEGYATWTAGQFDADGAWVLRLAFLTNRAPPLDSLTLDWPLMAADARMAYLLSASAVQYLYSLGPPETFERFLEVWAESGSFEQALREVYIVASPQFERLWRADVRRRFGWLQIIAQSMFVWTVLAALVIVLFLIRRRRDRRRLRQLEGQEPPDLPAYWLGEDEDESGEPPDAPGDATPPASETRTSLSGGADPAPPPRREGEPDGDRA
jgi:hypothetical protein